jgi:hypothetical protein
LFRIPVANDSDIAQGNGSNAWDSGDLLFQLPVKHSHLRVGISGAGRVELKEKKPITAEAEGRSAKVHQRAHKKPGAYQQDDGERDLRDDQPFA